MTLRADKRSPWRFKETEFLWCIGPVSLLVSGRVWNAEAFGLHVFGLGWRVLGGGRALEHNP